VAVDLTPFRSAILAARWGTLGVALALALAFGHLDRHPVRTAAWVTALVLVATYRTLRPTSGIEIHALLRGLALEAGVAAAAVMATGGWESPFTFTLLIAPITAGLAQGWRLALAVCAVTAGAVTVADVIGVASPIGITVQWIAELFLVALIAGYARMILGVQEEERLRTLGHIGKLSDANTLLFNLNRVAQSLPASLDLDEALDSTMGRLHDHFSFHAAAVLLRDDTDGQWRVVRIEGSTRVPPRLTTDGLSAGLLRALAVRSSVRDDDLRLAGLVPFSGSSLSGVLMARGSVIGLVTMEHTDTHHFTDGDLELLEGFVETAALALDNARWFRRLRTLGAEEERNRIARDLHDRAGQSLAYLAFELDRIVKAEERGEALGAPLRQLREEVRGVIGEVRETLYDLRTDVSEDQGLLPTLELFVDRLRDRSPLDIVVRVQDYGRLPVPQERELFRIAQEALVNVERHADAAQVTVTWRCDGRSGELLIVDDGAGFALETGAGRVDSYGLTGMRERAEAIGARLDVESTPGHGTFIRCAVTATAPAPAREEALR
jgi:signal transduction histidine kinase